MFLVLPVHAASYNAHIYTHYVGRAVFASKENETLPLPANGGSVRFNATVIYISGGSCNYRQNLNWIKLKKINDSEGMKFCIFNPSGGLLRCDPNNMESSVTLNIGHSHSEFVLTLFNLTTDNIGTYEVIVDLSDPNDGGYYPELRKKFHLEGK
jgi:hypothetical protein